jgi:hypothetical protein
MLYFLYKCNFNTIRGGTMRLNILYLVIVILFNMKIIFLEIYIIYIYSSI